MDALKRAPPLPSDTLDVRGSLGGGVIVHIRITGGPRTAHHLKILKRFVDLLIEAEELSEPEDVKAAS